MAEVWKQFGNPEKLERPPLEAGTKGKVKTQLTEKIYICAVMNCEVRKTETGKRYM
jgi:hypothetical protein